MRVKSVVKQAVRAIGNTFSSSDADTESTDILDTLKKEHNEVKDILENRDGDFRVQDNHGGSVRPYAPSAKEVETARAALSVVPSPPTYARVDLVALQGTPAVMELELIDPELYLRFFPTAVETFARRLVFILDRPNY